MFHSAILEARSSSIFSPHVFPGPEKEKFKQFWEVFILPEMYFICWCSNEENYRTGANAKGSKCQEQWNSLKRVACRVERMASRWDTSYSVLCGG